MSLRRRMIVLSFASCTATAVAAGCAEQKRGLGEQCLKDDDCLSGVCAELQCAAGPPLLDGSPGFVDASGPADGGLDASPDANPNPDGGVDSGVDAGVDAGIDAGFDAPADVTSAG